MAGEQSEAGTMTGETVPEATRDTSALPRVRTLTGTGTGPGAGLLLAMPGAETSAAGMAALHAQMTGTGVVGMMAGDTAVTEREGNEYAVSTEGGARFSQHTLQRAVMVAFKVSC